MSASTATSRPPMRRWWTHSWRSICAYTTYSALVARANASKPHTTELGGAASVAVYVLYSVIVLYVLL